MTTLRHNVWIYRDDLRDDLQSLADFVGYDVEATDGHIGKVDEASRDTDRRYLVVDTGFWIFGKKRMIPAGVITRVDRDSTTLWVSMTKDQIKGAPDFEEAKAYQEADYDRFGSYYDQFGW